MSKKNVMKFFGKMEEDPSLKKKVLSLDDKSRSVVESSINKMVAIAKAAGFEFSAQDLADTLSEDPSGQFEASADRAAVPYKCTAATAWKGHPPDPEGCAIAWGCGVQHPLYGGPHIPKCATRPV